MALGIFENKVSYFFRGFLTFHPEHGGKWSVREPSAAAGSRVMAIEYELLKALFAIPQLRATIRIDAAGASVPHIDVAAAQSALQAVLGVKVHVDASDVEVS